MASSVPDTATVTPNGTKALLPNNVSTFFINKTPTLINGARILSNPPSWLITFPVFPFDKIILFSKDLIISVVSDILS